MAVALTSVRKSSSPQANNWLRILHIVLQTLRNWWYVGFPVGILLAAGVIVGLALTHVPMYRSTAVIRLRSTVPYIVFPQGSENRTFVQSQIQLFRTRRILATALKEIATIPDVAVQEDAIRWLQEELKIATLGPELLEISIEATSPEAAQQIVRAVTEAYTDFNRRSDQDETVDLLTKLQGEEKKREERVEALRESLRTMTKAITGKDPTLAENGSAIKRSSPEAILEEQRIEAEVAITMLGLELKALEGRAGTEMQPSALEVEQSVNSLPRVKELHNKIEGLEEAIAKGESQLAPGRFKSTNSYKKLAKERQELQEKLDRILKEKREEFTKLGADAALVEHKGRIKQTKQQIDELEVKRQHLAEQIESHIAKRSDAGGDAVDLEIKRSELDHEDGVLERISSRIIAIRTELGAPTRIAILDEADLPAAAIEPAPLKSMALGGGLALVLPFVILGLWEQSLCRIQGVDSLRDTGLNVFGEVAQLPRQRSKSLKALDGVTLFEESVNSVRTSLQLSVQHRDKRVLGVVSAISREGKTHLASQLAISIARATGEPTLLIDADLRSPDIHRIFEVSNEQGLADVLAETVKVQDAIHAKVTESLHVMSAGTLSCPPHELLGRGNFPHILEELKKTYKYIIVDTPPILPASEALFFASSCEGTIFCVMRQRSRRQQVESAYAKLVEVAATPIGIVVNGVTNHSYGYSHDRYPYKQLTG